ncbi:ESPR-type extended signal peptide-containing protein [Paraburkholderia sp. HP33-1]|uniref:ESPR-type extended signal peptide-containing protein n=1 Tax=Paraburkholderia sp. HP33-1 TaxID=2883243 RepID=UPI003FA37EE5
MSGSWVVVSEHASSRGKPNKSPRAIGMAVAHAVAVVTGVACLASSGTAFANNLAVGTDVTNNAGASRARC